MPFLACQWTPPRLLKKYLSKTFELSLTALMRSNMEWPLWVTAWVTKTFYPKVHQAVGRVHYLESKGHRPFIQDAKNELPVTKALLQQWHKLKIGKDGLLRRERALTTNWCCQENVTPPFIKTPPKHGTSGSEQGGTAGNREILLAEHGTGRYTLCHQRVQLPETTTTKSTNTRVVMQLPI